MIGMTDVNGVGIIEGDTVEVRVKTWNGHIVICSGKIQYLSNDVSSWGCGYAVIDGHRTTFLSSISKGSTEIEVLREAESKRQNSLNVVEAV